MSFHRINLRYPWLFEADQTTGKLKSRESIDLLIDDCCASQISQLTISRSFNRPSGIDNSSTGIDLCFDNVQHASVCLNDCELPLDEGIQLQCVDVQQTLKSFNTLAVKFTVASSRSDDLKAAVAAICEGTHLRINEEH